MCIDDCLGFIADNRPDIGCQTVCAPDLQFLQSTLQHGKDAICHIFLQAKHTQSRATLTGTVKSRGNHIGNHLFSKCRRIYNHGVLAAGFSNQRNRLAVWQQTLGQLFLNKTGNFRGTGEHHCCGFFCTNKACANAAITRHKVQDIGRDTSFMQQTNSFCCNQRGFFSRFCQDGIACNKGCNNLSGENRQWKIPRADANNGAQRLMRCTNGAACLIGIVTQEINRLAHFSHRIWQRLARFPHDKTEKHRHFFLHFIGGTIQTGRAFRCRFCSPVFHRLSRQLHSLGCVLFTDFKNSADFIAVITRIKHITGCSLHMQ